MVRVDEVDELNAAGSVVVASRKEAVGVLADRWAKAEKEGRPLLEEADVRDCLKDINQVLDAV